MQFLRYASRLPCYDGAVAAAFRRRSDAIESEAAPTPAPPGPQSASVIDASPLNLRTNPLLTQYVDYG